MSTTLINYSFLTFIIASFVYAANNFTKREKLGKTLGYLGSLCLLVGLIMITAAILIRWHQAQRPPFSNMYESLVLFAWSIALIYLVLELVYGIRIAGAFAAVLAVVAIAAASFFDNTIEALVPALQSNWLLYHVLTCFVGYAAFAVSAAASVVYMILIARGKATIRKRHLLLLNPIAYLFFNHAKGDSITTRASYLLLLNPVAYLLFFAWGKIVSEAEKAGGPSELMRVLQSFNYEAVRFGFLFLGVGIITGAVWANEAWGTYWSWDPKEAWSLITWIIYAIMIHFKYVSGRFGIKDINTFNAVCSILGFLAVIFTYFGVNFILSGLHSYA